jgi:hypothetical protein
VPGISYDLLAETETIIGPPHVFTDGEWAWTADEIYYLEKYHIEVPDEFVQHMKANNWKCPLVDDSRILEIKEIHF